MNLNEKQAFIAMRYFLDDYYDRMPSDGLGGLLSDILPVDDNMPADPAAWEDWKAAIKRVMEEEN